MSKIDFYIFDLSVSTFNAAANYDENIFIFCRNMDLEFQLFPARKVMEKLSRFFQVFRVAAFPPTRAIIVCVYEVDINQSC